MRLEVKKVLKLTGTAEEKNLIKAKSEIVKMKKSGEIFFKEKVASLQRDCVIDFYHHYHPGVEKTYDAFPMPKYVYTFTKTETEKENKIKEYFKKYYGEELSNLNTYKKEPYIGKHTVWFHK